MKIRFLVVFVTVLSAAALTFSPVFKQTQSASELNAKCAMPNFENAYRQSKAVFLGEVTEEEKQGDTRVFDFMIEKYWKGEDSGRVKVYVYETARYQAWFKKGERYLVYAGEDADGNLRVGRCSRSNDAENAGEDLQKLGKGKIPR